MMPEALRPPDNVIAAICERWPERCQAWSADVQGELSELCARYGVTPSRVLPARYGFVVAARGDGKRLVLRATADPAGEMQARVAIAFADLGIGPEIREAIVTQTGVWAVMDEVVPGTALCDVMPSPEELASVADCLSAMKGVRSPDGLPSLVDWLRDRLTDDDLQDLPPGRRPAPLNERQAALRVLDTFGVCDWLCHGDLSRGNILLGADSRCFLIDPRGMQGDLAYDVAVYALKTSPMAPQEVVAWLSEALGIDPERGRSWCLIAMAARV